MTNITPITFQTRQGDKMQHLDPAKQKGFLVQDIENDAVISEHFFLPVSVPCTDNADYGYDLEFPEVITLDREAFNRGYVLA